jgi:MoaA/NifB/PqqE/SkfB family radical SAM enzyme
MPEERMSLEKLFLLISAGTLHGSHPNQKEIQGELLHMGISPEKQGILLHYIDKIRSMTSNPKTQASLFRSYFRIINEDIDKDGRGSSIIIEITKKCGKNCIHCYSKFNDRTTSMSDETLDRIITYARKNYKHVFFTGGEPTLDPRLFLVAERNPDIMFFIFTNGSMISNVYAQRLSELGNIIPLIGIDGSKPSTHDAFRGKGSYDEVMDAIAHLNDAKVSWGFISLVTEKNAKEVLSEEFLECMVQKGAIIARFLEYIPVGPKPLIDCILSGETYYFLEKRKNEINRSGIIYMQDIAEKKCNGLLFFSVNGDIKNCFCFHYAKYNVAEGDLKKHIGTTRNDWVSYDWDGECPLYSDPIGFKNHLRTCGWKNCSIVEEPYLNNNDIAKKMRQNYAAFLRLKEEKGL